MLSQHYKASFIKLQILLFCEKIQLHQKTKQIFVSSHTIEHLEDPASLLRKLSKVIKINDILYLQFPSMEKLIEQGRYDQICHQHINLFSLNSISNLARSSRR